MESASVETPHPPKLIFGLMSAVAKPATIEQLVRALQPHRVVIHHDFTQQPGFGIEADNATFVPNPRRTGYGVWALTEGVIRLVEHCVANEEFDYFQLISPACLPIKPLSQFQAYIASSKFDGHAEFCDLRDNPEAMLSFGHRVYAPNNSFRHRMLRRSRRWHLGRQAPELEDRYGIQIVARSKTAGWSPLDTIGSVITRLMDKGLLGYRLPDPNWRPMMGGMWFGGNRQVCQYIAERINEPAVYAHFASVNDFGEHCFATLLGNSQFHLGPFNTYVNKYKDWNPGIFGEEDLDRLAQLPQFFARKFPDDPAAPIRLKVLEWVNGERASPG